MRMTSQVLLVAIGVVAAPAAAAELPPPWPAPSPSIWPRPMAEEPFAAAVALQPTPLPLHRCGVGDCTRALPDDPSPPPRDAAPGFVQLFATSPFSQPVDHRHILALVAGAAITMLLWRNRGRRNTGF